MLHIIKSVAALKEAIALYAEDDEVLLIEDAVYVVNPKHSLFHLLQGLSTYALQSDIEARGIQRYTSPSVSIINYQGFVELTVKQANSLTWN